MELALAKQFALASDALESYAAARDGTGALGVVDVTSDTGGGQRKNWSGSPDARWRCEQSAVQFDASLAGTGPVQLRLTGLRGSGGAESDLLIYRLSGGDLDTLDPLDWVAGDDVEAFYGLPIATVPIGDFPGLNTEITIDLGDESVLNGDRTQFLFVTRGFIEATAPADTEEDEHYYYGLGGSTFPVLIVSEGVAAAPAPPAYKLPEYPSRQHVPLQHPRRGDFDADDDATRSNIREVERWAKVVQDSQDEHVKEVWDRLVDKNRDQAERIDELETRIAALESAGP